jgi:hypothetical protein
VKNDEKIPDGHFCNGRHRFNGRVLHVVFYDLWGPVMEKCDCCGDTLRHNEGPQCDDCVKLDKELALIKDTLKKEYCEFEKRVSGLQERHKKLTGSKWEPPLGW